MKPKEIIDKIQQTITLAIPFIGGVVGIWSKDIEIFAYIEGGGALVISALEYAKMFIKD